MTDRFDDTTLLSRRALLRAGAGAALLVSGAPLLRRGAGQVLMAQGSADPRASLQLASRFQSLHSALYAAGIAAPAVFNALSAGERTAIQQVAKHDQATAASLRSQLGADAPPLPASYDFTAGGAFPSVLLTRADFLEVAQLVEDATVRALKAQVITLVGGGQATELTLVMRLQQVQSRHAAQLRRLRGQTAWINGASFDAGYGGTATTPGTQASVARLVYGAPVTDASQPATSEDNRVQAGLLGQRTDAFDEPLPAADATAFLQVFGA
jgi:Ferritin-like domain